VGYAIDAFAGDAATETEKKKKKKKERRKEKYLLI
jgi:hypothetical protein